MLREEHFWNLMSLLSFDPALQGAVVSVAARARCFRWFEEKFVARKRWLHPETTLCLVIRRGWKVWENFTAVREPELIFSF